MKQIKRLGETNVMRRIVTPWKHLRPNAAEPSKINRSRYGTVASCLGAPPAATCVRTVLTAAQLHSNQQQRAKREETTYQLRTAMHHHP